MAWTRLPEYPLIRHVGGDGFVASRRGTEVSLQATPTQDVRAEVARLARTARADPVSAVALALRLAEAAPRPPEPTDAPAERRRAALAVALGRGPEVLRVEVAARARPAAAPEVVPK